MSDDFSLNNKGWLYFLGFLLVIIFFLAISISYSNGFNTALKSFCKGEKVLYDSLKGYMCDSSTSGIGNFSYVEVSG